MSVRLLLADPLDPAAAARAVGLELQVLQTAPGGEDITVSFTPNRADDLYACAKAGAQLAYRILFREGVVRSQLAVRCHVPEAPANVVGRSAELAFALAILLQVYSEMHRSTGGACAFPAVSATGALEIDGTVRAVEHVAVKLRAAVSELGTGPAVVFFPSQNAAEVERADLPSPPIVKLLPIGHLDEALQHLGIVLERVYLRNPFRGLEHFEYEHHSIFFGREAEVRELVQQLLRREAAGRHGVLVEGPSGSGKSSFLRAGVLPALVNPGTQAQEVRAAIQTRPVSAAVRRAIWRPGLMPFGTDERGIVRSVRECWAAYDWPADWHATAIETLAELAHSHRAHWPRTLRFVWVIDQLEEILTLRLEDAALEALGHFLRELQLAGVWTLACIRADAVPQLKRHEALRAVFGADEGQYYLPTVRGLALDDVITLPAKAADLTFGVIPDGKRLDALLRDEAYREQDSLPLLQFTLNELYRRRSGQELTCAAYRQLGGLAGSIATTAENVLKINDAKSHAVIARVFRSLVSVDEMGHATRRYAPMAEIEANRPGSELVARLVEARLCVTDQREGQSVVAFAHDSLLRTLPAFIEWLREEAALLQTRELARRDTHLWREHRESDAWLAGPDKLVAFRALDAAEIVLPPHVRRFIERSERQARRTSRIKQAAICLIAALAIAASIGAWIASRKQHEAQYQATQVLQAQSRLLVEAAAQRLKDSDVAGAQGIILEVLTDPAFAQSHTPAAISVFQEIRAADVQLAVLSGHGDRVNSAAYSPDGTRIVTASLDKTARIWDVRTGAQLAVLSGHGDRVTSGAYAPDGTRVVTASFDKTARIWDARTGAQLAVLSGHDDNINSAAYSPDGTRVVTASDDKSARIWDVRTGAQLAVLSGHGGLVASAAYSPDGTRIVTASFDKTARIWDARTGAQLAALFGHGGVLYSAAYSPDGTRIVTASWDNTARIWEARTGAQLAVLSGHGSIVYSAAYSPDGTRIVTSSFDNTARIWEAHTSEPLAVLSGHGDAVYSAPYSPDGTRIVTASADKTARIWEARTGVQLAVLLGHGGIVDSAAYSPDGTRIVTASWDKTARTWDARTGAQLAVLSGHGGLVESAAYSPDGTRIVTASFDKTARIWDARTGAQLAVLSGHRGVVYTAAYSPDGTRIVTASGDKTARMWDVRTGAQLAVLSGHGGDVNTAEYSPDGTRIVTASFDKTARIWDARTGAQLAVLSGHSGDVNAADYSPDGTQIVTASADKTARIWDARTGVQLAVLSGHGDIVYSAAYSPDGTRVVTASDDKTARVWDGRVPANIAAQILWDAAAETDSLPDVDRTQLGLLPDPRARKWRTHGSACDQAAAAFYDPDRLTPGLAQATIVADVANSACSSEIAKTRNSSRLVYQMGRALLAKSDVKGARQQFELAVSEGYRAAWVDLANLLVDASAEMLDPERAVSLYEKAWRDGVPIAAFELGHLYEVGVSGSHPAAPIKFQPDRLKAWSWYQKGADVGEPSAVARFAERYERNAIAETDPQKRDALLLQAFSNYAAASERAHDEDWPDDAWRHWRYRRATLARFLAREAMMQQVADAYQAERDKWSPQVPTFWRTIEATLHLQCNAAQCGWIR